MSVSRRLKQLSDERLLARLKQLVSHERRVTARVIAALAEVDRRRLFAAQGYSSLYEYSVRELRLTEHAAYQRIEAARVVNRFPDALEMLESGDLSATALCLIARRLNEANYRDLLDRARGKTKAEVEELLAALHPQPPVRSMVRRIPLARAGAEQAAQIAGDRPVAYSSEPPATMPSRPPVIKPLAPDIFKIQFTLPRETRNKLRCAQDLLRHSIPNGDIAVVFDRALDALLAELEKKKLGIVAKPLARQRPANLHGRHIPAAVRREVWRRDGGQCAFVGASGRCGARGALEFHHVIPHAVGGEAIARNIELRCRAHNAHERDTFFTWLHAP